jgi:predicted nucleic acid-binding protein
MTLFVDTSAWYALNDRSDQHRDAALERMSRISSGQVGLITSDYILDESLTLISARTNRKTAVAFGDLLLKSSTIQLVTITEELRQLAFELFRKYADKDLSFTDCTSFALMKQLKLKTAFTFDDHFRQVGFEIW